MLKEEKSKEENEEKEEKEEDEEAHDDLMNELENAIDGAESDDE